MKRILSVFLSAVLAISMVPVMAFADTVNTNSAAGTGEFLLSMHRREALAATNFTVMLKASNGSGTQTKQLKAAKDEINSEIFFEGIANGTYELTVTASKYLTYKQMIDFDGRCVNIDLYNYQSANDGLSGNAKLGVMPAGDMNGDGAINDADADLVKNAIEKNNTAYDLSGNGVVDLDDVAFVVRNAGRTVAATPMRTISGAVLKQQTKVSNGTGTSIQGTASNLLAQNKDAGNVSLKRSDNSKISASKPVEVNIETQSSSQSLQNSQALVIAAPENSNGNANTMAAGTVTVEGVDSAGKTVTVTANVAQNTTKSAASMSTQNALASYGANDEEAVEATEESSEEATEESVQQEAADDQSQESSEDAQEPATQPSAQPEDVVASAAQNAKSAAPSDISGNEAKESYAVQADEVTVENDGSVVINLGTRVAIKKVTIRVTATANQGNLAEIAKVEFLSDFAERIAEPQLSIPTVTKVTNTNASGLGYKNITINWTPQTNVTGYEVSISGPSYNKTALETTTSHTFIGDSFNGTIKSFQTYDIKVRSVSGDWRSDWSEVFKHEATATNKPPAPQYVSVTPLVERLNVSWNCKFDAEWFTLYYREKNSNGDYAKIENITGTTYSLAGLDPEEYYQVYVVAHNRNGESPKSVIAEGRTLASDLTRMPKYDLLNFNDQTGMATTGIKSVTGNRNKSYEIRNGNKTVNQAQATYEDWKAVLDNNPDSYAYIPDWDSGVSYDNFRGPIIELSARADVDTFRFSPSDKVTSPNLYEAKIRYKDYNNGAKLTDVMGSVSIKYDSDNHKYYEIVTDEPINSDYFELRLRNFNSGPITIQELKIYKYNSLDRDIEALFTDQMRTMVKEGTTVEQVQALIDRAEAVDPSTGEQHPHHDSQIAELNYAMDIVKNGAHEVDFVQVDNQITSRGEPASGFAQALSDNQPAGYVAGAGDTIVVYVTDRNGKTARGARANLNLVCTQMHPEVTYWQRSVELKAGRNEITIPVVSSLACEHGGALYLQYTGDKGYNDYRVRILGATKIPVLRATGLTGTERRAAIETYVTELKTYATAVQASHNKVHKASTNPNVNSYAYDEKNCILNYTDITMDNMMYSFPATQVNKALGASATTAARADKLENALAGMETQIDYFYQFKGLNKAATDNDRYPKLRLNLRYHRMFTGAFMYAAGKHIGIEWGSTTEPFGLTPVTADSTGQKTGGSMTGWAIAHEIGHCINASAYQRVEVTNNVFAQIAKAASSGETSSAFRSSYDKVYAGVVAGNVAHNGDLGVQLAQYWQLHLAYDDNYLFKKFDSISEQQAGLFYARVDSYLRDRSKLPKPFIGNPSGDQLFMQACCAAANKNVLDFFTAWGYKPDASTIQYASQFENEDRKIQYINDDARLWRIQKKGRMSSNTIVTAKVTNATNNRINGNKVQISLANNNTVDGAMLGYEIKRNGTVVGFVDSTKTSFTDILTTENNKAFTYEVTAFDKYLNATATVNLGEVKVCHDGAISKANWTATSTTATSKQDQAVEGSTDDPDAGAVEGTTIPGTNKVSGAKNVIDDNASTIFCAEGGTSATTRPNIVINLGGQKQVTALKFTPAKKSSNTTSNTYSDIFTDDKMNQLRPYGYKIELSQDGNNWTTVKEGSLYQNGFKMDDSSTWKAQSDIIVNNDSSVAENKSLTIFFSQRDSYGNLLPYMNTYDASFVRLTATNMSAFATAEIDILGPTSDNVDLIASGYGTLSNDFYYDSHQPAIPKGARVLYGEYKGDPAYNVVILKDQDGNVIDGQSIILADVAEKGMLGETSDGRWIFWMENKTKTDSNGQTYNELQQFDSNVKSVKAELYRVQDAQTLAGQRITSTSLTLSLPSKPGNVTLTSASAKSAQNMNVSVQSNMYMTRNSQAVNDEGNVVFDDAATVDDQAIEVETSSNTNEVAAMPTTSETTAAEVEIASIDGKMATLGAVSNNEGSTVELNSMEAVENASAGEVANLFAGNDSIDVDQASLQFVDSGFAFKVNPSSISIASEGVFSFNPALPANVKVDVKGLTNAKSANATYNGSYRDSQGRLHVFVIARSGVLANCVTSQNNLSFTGSISGMTYRVKGTANYIRDINGSYDEPTVTNIGDNAVDFFAYRAPVAITSATVSPTSYTYTKKAITPKLVVKSGNTVLRAGVDYTVTYSGARKNVGTYKATITGIGSYTGTKAVSFKIVPKSTTVKKLTAKKKSIVVTVKKQATQTTGYKIRYSLKKNMKSSKTVTVNKAKTTKTTIKKLKSKKTYYVQVSTFKKIGKTIYQSSWSKAKKVKVK